ncbi:MAG: rhomboid family intramembrane serine protease [Gemmataceae bacterium]
MVFPLYDDNTGRQRFPFVNYTLIVINVLVFVFMQGMGENEQFTFAFATVPREIVTGQDIVETQPQRIDLPGVDATRPPLERTPISVYLTLLTSMFMHAGWLHLLGNMLFLWIFGDNVEDDLGHFRYILFYLICGLVASLAHVFLTVGLYGVNSPQAMIPCLGASGAISGVLGGYIVLHPHRRVWVFVFRFLVQVPAYIAIGLWFVLQLISFLGMLGEEAQTGGVAFAAHVGGFLAGLALVSAFAFGRDIDNNPQPRRRYR